MQLKFASEECARSWKLNTGVTSGVLSEIDKMFY